MMIVVLDLPAVTVVPGPAMTFVHVAAAATMAPLDNDVLIRAVSISVRDPVVPRLRRVGHEHTAKRQSTSRN